MSDRILYKTVDLNGAYEGVIEVYDGSIIVSKEEIINGGGGQCFSTELTWAELIKLLDEQGELIS